MSLDHALLHQRPRYPGAVNSNIAFIDTSGLLLWLDSTKISGLSDNDKVSQWDDLSGNSLHAVQANATYQPTYKTNIQNGLPAVLFGSAAGVKLIAPSAELDIFSLYLVIHKVSRIVTFPVFFEQDDVNTGILVGESSTASYFRYVNNAGDRLGSAYSTTTSYYLSFLASASQIFAWINGASQGIANNASGATTRDKTFTLGESSANTNRFNGYIMEVLLFSVNHSGATRLRIESYLASKWGL